MITTVHEERMVVVSDVHLGNRMFRARRALVEFLRFVRLNKYCLCINGDGVDIVQTTLGGLSRDLSECTSELRKFAHERLPVYYTVGNHDIVLEHFLDDWELVRVAPFLNVHSGASRIRVEHGHLYDEAYVKFPGLYKAATHLGGLALRVHPRAYKALERAKVGFERLGRLIRPAEAPHLSGADDPAIPGEPVMFRERATEISRHGFDAVIFGHTHCWGQVTLRTGATYINTGSWFFEPHYAEINEGRVALRRVADCGRDVAQSMKAAEVPVGAT